jgi:hypothetical protein
MQYKATISFSGKISMMMGEVREISDQSLIDDLTHAGYIIPYEADEKPKPRRKGKKDES